MNDEENRPSAADHVGQAAGGITGVLAGAAIGAPAGPIGVLLGGIAGAIGGWWSGRALAEAAEDITEADDEYYRADFSQSAEVPGEYDRAKRAYYLGDVAAANPEYEGRSFDDIEPELSRGWRDAGAANDDDWRVMRRYASVGYQRGRERRRQPRDSHDRRASR
jgi:hypothetical protein